MSGRTQRQRKLTDTGMQYRKQLVDTSKRADDKKKLQDAMKDLAGVKVGDRVATSFNTGVSGPTPSAPLPGSSVIRPPTFQYPPPPKDNDLDDLTSRFGKMGGKTRRRNRKHKKRARK